jgi:hypothetical protein
MKKITLLLAGVLVSTFAFAFEPGPGSSNAGFAIVKKNESTFKLYYKADDISNVKVTIADSKGNIVYRDYVRGTSGFVRPYDLDGLKKDIYVVTLDDGTTKKQEVFNYNTKQEVKAANVLQLASNKYLLAVQGKMVAGKINVKVYNGSTLLHQQQSDISGDFSQIFRIENIGSPVTFEVTDANGKKLN